MEGGQCGFGKIPISPEKQLYITLYVLGTPDSYRYRFIYCYFFINKYFHFAIIYRSVVTKFDVGKATAWRTVKRVVKAICKLRRNFIQWPTEQEAFYTSNRIERRYKFPNVLGAVDGTHIKIPSPKRDSQSYINRKGVYSIQLEVSRNIK